MSQCRAEVCWRAVTRENAAPMPGRNSRPSASSSGARSPRFSEMPALRAQMPGGHQHAARPHATNPLGLNGQGVGLLIRRLRVRVPQGVRGRMELISACTPLAGAFSYASSPCRTHAATGGKHIFPGGVRRRTTTCLGHASDLLPGIVAWISHQLVWPNG